MPAVLINPPASEPLSLADAKRFLRVEHDDDDDVILSIIGAARGYIESHTRTALITQTWRLVRDAWPANGVVRVVPAPVQSVSAARVYDGEHSAIDIDPGVFVADLATSEICAPAFSLPQPRRAKAGIEMDVVIGFGDQAEDVPAPLRQAVRHLVAHWYENRGLAVVGHNVALMPASVNAMLTAYRVVSL